MPPPSPVPDPPEITRLLRAWGHGDEQARDRLLAQVYAVLRQQAARHLRRERPNHTLRPTALVNEVYLRLVDQQQMDWQDRAHFFAVTAKVMRQVLVDHARRRGARKRAGAWYHVTLDEGHAAQLPVDVDVLALEDALQELGGFDADKARLVELRFFGGLTIQETAEVMGVSTATITREWKMAKAWLFRRMQGSSPAAEPAE